MVQVEPKSFPHNQTLPSISRILIRVVLSLLLIVWLLPSLQHELNALLQRVASHCSEVENKIINGESLLSTVSGWSVVHEVAAEPCYS